MRDWQKDVQARLGALGLDPACEQEIIAELAGYLEDRYEECRRKGAAEKEALSQAMAEVSNWARLGRRIRRARQEGNMSDRLKTLWLPGFAISLLAVGWLTFLTHSGPQPHMLYLSEGWGLFVYVPWVVSLPVVGALGSFWARRTGGSIREVIAVGLFPVAVLFTIFFVIVPVTLIVGAQVPLRLFLKAFVVTILDWVLIPGAALLVGVSPFLKRRSRKSPVRLTRPKVNAGLMP